MMNTSSHLFNIPLSRSFWDTLARIYIDKYKGDYLQLANVLFLLPNRRACIDLTNAFVRIHGKAPVILPQMLPIADMDDDEVFFNGFNLDEMFNAECQTISRDERLFLFTRLIMSKPSDFGLKQISLAQALNLAVDLAKLIDTAINQGLSFDKLQDLVPEKYATHWQETLKLLKIITEFWPMILKERNAVDACSMKNSLLFKQAQIWNTNPVSQNIVVAGVTASFPAIIALLKSIMNLPNGEIYFSGIDRFANQSYWNAVDETHPLFEIKTLLELLEISLTDVVDVVAPSLIEREQLISEIMRPASVSDKWRQIYGTFDLDNAIKNISVINCHSQRDEALAIALKMREVLNTPEKTAALITYDRNLARRVASELERFEIKIDDSAGLPLSLTSIGIFFRLLAEAAANSESDIAFITLLKHPFMLVGSNAAVFRNMIYTYETALRQSKIQSLSDEIMDFINKIKSILADFSSYLAYPSVSFKEILIKHISLAEVCAASDTSSGNSTLWKGDAGKTAAKFFTQLLSSSETLGNINGQDYLPLLCELMGLESVRARYGTHPRLSILGPIEARLHHFDTVILGEVNEGIWPKPAQADMWMSRPMKKDFGFSLPEKAIGILGADLCGFLAAPQVVITRAERVDGVPMKKSRWLLRFETVLKAMQSDILKITDDGFSLFANRLDKPTSYTPIKAPAPCPPLSARPRRLSASGVDLLVQDPYSVFAKYILKLYPLDDLDQEKDQRDYGTLIHAIIEEFNNTYPSELPENPLEILIALGRKYFADFDISPDLEAFWWPKFLKTAEWIVQQETDYRHSVKLVHNEIKGEITYNLPNGPFTFTAKADRIDELQDGYLNILDYKTGKIPSSNEVKSGHALQLPLEGLIASKGHFETIDNMNVKKMIYWQLGSSVLEITPQNDDILQKTEEYLLKLIETFDFETTPYHSRPIPKFIPKNSDYEHLARIREWSVQEEGESNED